jgi:protein tyrosine phosphatase
LEVKLEKCVAYWSNKKCNEKLVLGGYETMVQNQVEYQSIPPIINDTHIETYLLVLISEPFT